MIANFFANVFFFINGAMFNMFIEQGPEMGLFEYSKGIKVRRFYQRQQFKVVF